MFKMSRHNAEEKEMLRLLWLQLRLDQMGETLSKEEIAILDKLERKIKVYLSFDIFLELKDICE
jgi:hypothetical protein